MKRKEPMIPDALPNQYDLRMRALALVGSELDKPLDLKESLTIGAILRRKAGLQPELFADIARDMNEYEIPRFTMLVGLLAPYGLMLKFPSAILAVAKFLLGETRDVEMAKVDWPHFRKLYPGKDL